MSSLCVREYNPDVWTIVEISGSDVEDTYYRVLAGWYGGYTRGDSWKMNSGITKIVEHTHFFEVHGSSGSIYNLTKGSERFSNYTHSVYSGYAEQNTEALSINVVDMSDVLEKFIEEK